MKIIFSTLLAITLISCSSINKKDNDKVNISVPNKKSFNTEVYTENHTTGELKIKGNLVKNIRQGLWTAYYKDGKTWSETNYSDGKRHGKVTSYYTNGNLRYLGHFTEDKKDGQWFFYNKNGQFEKEINYDTKK